MTSTERRATRGTSRAIIDIGSNTVRLVIYGGPARAPNVLHNEKVTARLGKGVAETGLLGERASNAVLAALARYRVLLQLKGVERVDVVATAAVRDATNGAAFLEKVAKLGFAPRLLSGEEEAVTSAHGVLGAFPGASGVVGDLGGGSLELVDIDGDTCRHGVSMPLGTLRLAKMRATGDRLFAQAVAKALKKAAWAAEPGTTLYLVGGSLRAFARFAMVQLEWPIDDPHGFVLDAAEGLRIARNLARRKPESLRPLAGISTARMNSLPDTAALLAVLIRRLKPGKLVFSAWGLREGLLYEDMPAGTRGQDPLVAGMSAFVQEQGISPQIGAMVAGWTVAAAPPNGIERRERLRLAATMLCLASATVEPNLRGDIAREWALRKRWIGAATAERAILAVAMLAHTGRLEVPPALAALIPAHALREAQAWGLATRLCRRFSTCAPQGLSGSRLLVDGGRLVLEVQPTLAPLVNDGVERDLRALAAHLGLKAQVA
ncbi:Ppx/GppA family phosphatase [Novosphingobium acidiphilum]|jgi:exopolyphosphatase/guanosine-5'-triphosphate,3'-diphosphate pyrophosphatase|uniref:Ppx/GppA family phosphatase n=1 Tax=Novosphingobium acidiphilum TaxID=505248 RepID=UPI0004204186|nr:Ppx/GppA family phosphatase [Novosphingobium acidiphilum]